MVGGKRTAHTVVANVKEFSKNALRSTNRAIKTTISNYTPFISASLMNASTAAFDASRFVKENNPLMRNKNKDPYVRRAINRASDAFQTSLNELRQGHLSFEETRNEISEYVNENSESEWDSMAASADGEAGGAGGGSQKQFSVSDYVKGVAASSRSNVRALQVTTNKITESQYKSLNLATSKIVSSNMANMQAITRQFSVTNSRIENVNANLVNLVQFNNTTMSEYIQTATTHMATVESFMEEILAYARLDNEKRVNNTVGSRYRSRREEEDSKDFLSYGFDPGKYAKSIIDNLMETAFGPVALGGIASAFKGIFGKVPKMLEDFASGSLAEIVQQLNPIQLLAEKFMPSLKGFTSVDDVIQKTITSFFTQLGSGTYDGPFSEIFRLFGIRGSTANIDRGDYNHGEAPWTGEDSRALKQVIPEYLSTIELKMSNMVDQSIINTNATIDAIRGIQATILMTSSKRIQESKIPQIAGVGRSATNSRRIYDYDAGDFTSEDKVIDKLRNTLQRTTSMYYDDSKDVIKRILQYADPSKMANTANKKALSDALTEIFMNFNATTGETALSPQEKDALVAALQGLGVNTGNHDIQTMIGEFINTTQTKRFNVNRDVGQEFQAMRNLGLGANTNDITTDIVNHNQEVINSYKSIFTLESILRTLDDDLDNFQDFKRTTEYQNMDRETKKAYDQMARNRNNAFARQGLISALLDTSRLQNNPFNIVAGTVVDTAYATASSLQNVVTGVTSFSDEIRHMTDTLRDAITSIRSILPGSGGSIEGHSTGATDIDEDKIVKVHKGEIILDPKLSARVRNGIVRFINGDIDEDKFNRKYGSKLSGENLEDIKLIQKAVSSVGKIKIKDLRDVTDQIWDAGSYIASADSQSARLELLLQQIAYNQRVGIQADNINAIREAGSDEAALSGDEKDRKKQALHRGIGKLNGDNLYEGGVLSDFANSVKGTYDKVINSIIGKAYNTYEDGGDGKKKLVHHEANDKSFLKRYKQWLVGRAEDAADALGIKGKSRENISNTVAFLGENGHKLVLGGLAGMVANCFLPIACGPLIGVGASIVASSKTINERLFGTKDELTGRRDNDGIISGTVTNFIKDNIFSLISGGLLGAKVMKSGAVSKALGSGASKVTAGITGLLNTINIPGTGLISQFLSGAVGIAFGPVGGALLGMGVAAMAQSEHVKKFLFGERDDTTGKRDGGVIGTMQKAFSNLGSSLRDHIFGKDVEYTDENGNRVRRKDGSGILNRFESAVYAHVLRPIKTSADYIGKYFVLWFKDDILNATERIVFPMADGINKLADSIRDGLGDMFHKHAESVKEAFAPVTKAITGISSKLAKATLTGVESIIKLSLKSVSAPLNIVAGLLGRTKLGKPQGDGKHFLNVGNIGRNLLMTGENFRLLFNELGNGAKQFINLRNNNKKGKGTGIIDKFERFLDRTEGIFGGIKTVRDFFKGLENSPLVSAITTPIKTVLNVLTHPFSVILKNVAEGVMDGFKKLITAPFKLLSLPFKGIKWVGSKIFNGEGKVGKALSNFKDRSKVIFSGGSVDPNASDLTQQFATAYNALGKTTTARAASNGLITKAQQGAINANNAHKVYQSDKKALEKQHKRNKALDNYISKLNIQMSPAEFDALPANKRNDIIRKLARKSGNREILKWDEEHIRALVTGGRSKVDQLNVKNQSKDKATENVANLPTILNNSTSRIVDLLQLIYDALTGKTNTSNTSGNSTNGGVPAVNKPGQDPALKLATDLNAKMKSDPSFVNLYPELAAVSGKPDNIVASWLRHIKSTNPKLYKDIDLAVHRRTTGDTHTTLVTSLTKIGQRKNVDAATKNANADAALNAAIKRLGIDPSDIDKKTMKKLQNISTSLVNTTPGTPAYDKIKNNLLVQLQSIGNAKLLAWNQTKRFNSGIKSLSSTKNASGKLKSWFDADLNDSSSSMQYDPTTHKMVSTTTNGKYNWDDNAKRFVVADKVKVKDPNTGKEKWAYAGSHNLTAAGTFKKMIRQRRDGTTDAINPDGSLNTNGMNFIQKFIAFGMLGKGWQDKKSKGELDRDKEQQLTSTLKMLATGSGKVKLISQIVGKVIKGLFSVGTFLVGLGAFSTYIYPMIKDPIHDILFGKGNEDGLLSKVKTFFVGKGDEAGENASAFTKSGIFGLIKTALVGNPELAEDPDATTFEKGGLFGMTKGVLTKILPTLFAKGADLCENLVLLLGRSLKDAVEYFFARQEEKKKAKDNNTGGAQSLADIFEAATRKEKTDIRLADGTILNVVDDSGNINFENLKAVRVDQGYSMSDNTEATTDDYKTKVAFAQFGIPLEIHSGTGNIDDAAVRKSGKYFLLTTQLNQNKCLGLSENQIKTMKSLQTKNHKKVDGYLFILTGNAYGSDATYTWGVFNNAQWSIYPAIWNDSLEIWTVSPTRCGFCTAGFGHDDTQYDAGGIKGNDIEWDSDIRADMIDSSDGTWSSYSDMRQESKSIYVEPEKVQYPGQETSEGSGYGSIGYGHFTQNDPRWARIGYGKTRHSGMTTMANGGCGPTAMANAINNVYGRNVTNPVSIANYASKNGYNVDGGTSAGLFTRGARSLGVSSKAIGKSGSSIANQLRHGKNVIVAGRGGNAYTSAGHIMSVRGIDGAGNAIVDDPMRRKSRHISMRNLTRGMTHAWSIGRGPDVYYGNSPDGSNYAFMRSYYDSLGSNFAYYDTSTGNKTSASLSNPKVDINNGSIIWGYDDNYGAACFVKSIASAVFNLYAKKKGLTNQTVQSLISSLANSIAQPHTLQSKGSYGANTGGFVTDYSLLANNVYAALSASGGTVGNGSGISLNEHRGSDPTTQKQLILGNLQSGKPVIIHTDPGTSSGLSSAYRSAVFGNWNGGGARDNHAVIIDGTITSGGKTYALIGDPGSSQASRGQQTGAQIRFVDFDQLTDPLVANRLNHLLTINDGANIPMPNVTTPNPGAGIDSTNKTATVSGSNASSNNNGEITIGTDATESTTTKSKFTSFTDWIGKLVKNVANIGSALITALFSGRTFKEVWAEMNAGEASANTVYNTGSTNVLYNPTTYMSEASDEYKAAYEMIMTNEHNTGTRGYINLANIANGLKFVNYDKEKYEHFMDVTSERVGDIKTFCTNRLTSKFASDFLGMALYYIKEHTPKAIDGNFKRYCIVIANIFASIPLVNRVYNDYKNSKLLFIDIDGIFMYAALCFEKLLLSDSDADRCAKKFLNAAQIYTTYTKNGKKASETDISAAKKDMKDAAISASLLEYNYMRDNLLMMTYDEAKKIVSEQAAQQTAQVDGYSAASDAPIITDQYTGEWAPNASQQWIVDPVYIKNTNLINQYAKPENNYSTASSGISNTYQPGYFRPGFSTMQQPNYSQYGRQLTRDLRTFPTITVDKMNQVIQSVSPNSPFVGHGQAFINASNMTGVDPLYLYSQTWESGFGTAGQSHLSKGNYHGLVAYESTHPRTFLKDGVATIDSGIMGGSQILSKYYINRDNPHQNNILSLCDDTHCYNSESANYANINASHLYEAEKAAGFGAGKNAVNIHDAMMNTPTSDIYTNDDVYMGDADHPMNVKMDTSSTTSRLDMIIQLLSELLKGDNRLPAATSKATETVAGYGNGKSSNKDSSGTKIIIANQQSNQKPNTNVKHDGLRNIYDRISKRALTYAH